MVLLAAGKAAGSMAEVAEGVYLDRWKLPAERLTGVAVARHGYGRPTRVVEMIEAGHPMPDAAGLKAAERALALADAATADDLVLVLMSGGASANWIAPARGRIVRGKTGVDARAAAFGREYQRDQLRAQTSLAHQGRAAGAPRLSGATGHDRDFRRAGRRPFRDRLRSNRARSDHAGRRARQSSPNTSSIFPRRSTRALADAANETPKPGDAMFAGSQFMLAARPADALRAAQAAVVAAGYECISLGDRVEGEAREVAQAHAALARDVRAKGKRAVILSGGELTVTIRGQGRGGPNQEYALALAIELAGMPAMAALAGDTDGTDGGAGSASDPAGALIDGDTVARAKARSLDPAAFLAENDSTGFFEALGDLLAPGPTFTNVNDFRAIVVDRA